MNKTLPTPELDLQSRSSGVTIESPATPTDSSAPVNPAQTYAKGLMDELFGDLDGLLDGTLVPPSEPLKVEEPKPKPPINLDFATFLSTHPSLSASPSLLASLSSGSSPEMLSIPQEDAIDRPASTTEIARHEARQSSYGLFEKMLIFVGCSSAVAAVMIMLGSQGVIGRVRAALSAGPTNSAASLPVNPNDVKFADYMGKALDTIDTKVKSTNPAAAVPSLLSIPGTSTLPAVKVPKALNGTNAGSSIVIGGLPRPVMSSNSTNVVPANGSTNAMQNELNQAVSKLSNLVDRLSGGASRSPVVVAPSTVTNTARAPITTQAPAPQRTLKAVMELGAQSVVLFEMNGVSQRYEKGENIGSSGWVVVKIENGSAIVRRNGEVRTLSVGQKI